MTLNKWQEAELIFFSEMVPLVFEIKYYLKDNESNYTLRNHKSCQRPWHGQRQHLNRFYVICTTLKWDITGLGLQPRVSFSLLFYFGSNYNCIFVIFHYYSIKRQLL